MLRFIVCSCLLGAASSLPLSVVAPAFAQEDALPENEPLTPERLVTAVLERNPSLEAQRAAMEEAAARVKSAGALDDPMLSVGLAPRTVGNSIGTRGDLGVSQALPWWGTRAARTALARANAEAAAQDVQALALRLRATAQSAFADWRYIDAALAVNQHHQALYAELREAAKARFASGLAPEQDVLQADVERTMLRQEALELRQQKLATQSAINALLNRPGDAPLPPAAPLPPPSELPPLPALAAFSLEQHPDVRQLQSQQRAASEEMVLAEKSRFPNFQVSADYNSMWDNSVQRPMVGVSINVPLNQDKRRADMDAARARMHRSVAALTDLTAHLRGELTTAYAAVQEMRESLTLYRDQLAPLANSTVAVSRSEYAAGQGRFVDVITAEHNWFDAELGLARAEAQLYQRLAELGRLAGTSVPIELPRAGHPFNAEEASHE